MIRTALVNWFSEIMNVTRFLKKCEIVYYSYFLLFGVRLVLLDYSLAAEITIIGNGSLDLSYKEELDNFTISRIYNSSLNKMQYMVQTNYAFADGDIKIIPLLPCESNYIFEVLLNVNDTDPLYIPSAVHNYSLQENCNYKIEVKVNRHVLDIINYIPDGDLSEFETVNSTYIQTRTIFLQPIYRKTIDSIQYILKWIDYIPPNGYDINILQDDSNEYCKSNSSAYQTWENITEVYIPALSSNFELHENCKYYISISVDGQIINVTNYISGNIKVEHAYLYTIYNESIHKIQYILRWNDIAPKEYTIDVTNKDSITTYCRNDNFNYDFNSSNIEVHIPPTKSDAFHLEGKCRYDIDLKYDDQKTKIVNYIPECVGPLCNCNILKPEPIVHPSLQKSDDVYNISWYFSESENNNITDYGFYMFHDGSCNSYGHYKKISPILLENSYAILNKDDIKDGSCLTVSFNNTYLCTYSHAFGQQDIETSASSSSGSMWMYWLIAIVLFVMAVVIVSYCFRASRRNCTKIFEITEPSQINEYPISDGTKKKERINLLYVEKEILDGVKDEYEVPRARISLIKEIGKGAFGEVLLATALINGRTMSVAVKKLREKATHEERNDFSSEIDILKKIGYHQNIVRLVGCCTLEEPYMMIMEFVPCGDLKQYLLDLRNKWQNVKTSVSDSVFTSRSSAYIVGNLPDSPNTPGTKRSATTEYINVNSIDSPSSDVTFDFEIDKVLDHKELQSFALQIAKGMAHLEKIPITHRDLAARNILISKEKVLKISDFGLSRKGPYINNKAKKLPLRWMAIESIEDHIYDNKSDVWSFAVVLWEIATLGAFPYEKIPDSMLLYFLQNGKRLSRPEICTDELYSLMLRCWSQDKCLRPSFADLVEVLDIQKTRVYVDFSQLNPMYVFPPTSNNPEWFMVPSASEQTPKYLEFA